MNELITKGKVKTIDSREVAEMIGKRHDNLIRDIKGYVSILKESSKLRSQDFFIESTYVNSQNKEQPCYQITKMGCEMCGNKLQREKGILFTANYVKRFNEMENQLLNPVQGYLDMSEEDRAILYFTKLKESKQLEADKKQLEQENEKKAGIISEKEKEISKE